METEGVSDQELACSVHEARAQTHVCGAARTIVRAGADGVWRIERVFEHSQIAL